MKEHNKRVIAGDFLVEAVEAYKTAVSDADYAKCILLAGATIGIISPLLEELGIKPQQVELAERAAGLSGIDLTTLTPNDRNVHIAKGLRFYRFVSNALKHTGNERYQIKASADLTFEADLKDEAQYLISTAIDDLNKLGLPVEILNTPHADKLLHVLHSTFPY